MEEQSLDILTQREFGYAKIVWEIENCFCVTYRDKWKIYSPEFSINGFLSIKWRFILQATHIGDNIYLASIQLERLSSGDISRSVKVFWYLSFSDGNVNINLSERESVFEGAGCMSSRINKFGNVQGRLQQISTDKFNVEALFLVTKTEDSEALGRSNDVGLRNLSQELGSIYNLQDYHDVTVDIGEHSVKGHKAILTTGNRLLRDNMGFNYQSKNTKVDWSDGISAGRLFNYLYTGNLSHVLRWPSILIDQAINVFGVEELQDYYLKDKLILRTKLEARELFYKWKVTDLFSDNNGLLLSPHFGARELNITFRLRLQMTDIFTPTGFLTFFLEASAFPQEFKELFVILEILSIFGNSINQKRAARWSVEQGQTLTFQNFSSSGILRPLAAVGNRSACIICSLYIPSDLMSSSVVSNTTCLLPSVNYEGHYRLLSRRIESLFNSGHYSDLLIRCGTRRFLAHKFILSARSPVFAKAIRVMEGNRGFSVPEVEPHIMEIIFRYIYSGALRNYQIADVPKIFEAAVKFCMLVLKYQCAKVLENNLQAANVLDILFLAHSEKELRLKLSTFRYLMYNRRVITQPDQWERLVNETALYEEFRDFVRRHIQNNPDEGLRLEDF